MYSEEINSMVSYINKIAYKSLGSLKSVIRAIEAIKISRSLPAQKSEEWLRQRMTHITASNCSLCLGGKFFGQTLENYIEEKAQQNIHHESNEAMEHGTLFEPVATMLWTKLFGQTVYDVGLIEHRDYPFLGASADGILLYFNHESGSMVGECIEIKVPYRRNNICFVPDYYYTQMQLQLEVLDLEVCNFFVCKINLINEPELMSEMERVKLYNIQNDTQKGRYNSTHKFIGIFIKERKMYPTYLYGYDTLRPQKFLNFVEKIKSELQTDYERNFELKFYVIENYFTTQIFRNSNWFECSIYNFVDVYNKIITRRNKLSLDNHK